MVGSARPSHTPVQASDKARHNFQEILGKPIRDLGLKLEGSPVERLVNQLYRELGAKGLPREFKIQGGPVSTVEFSPDGQRMFVAVGSASNGLHEGI